MPMPKCKLMDRFHACVYGAMVAAALTGAAAPAAAQGTNNCGRTVFYGDSIAQGLFDTARGQGWNAVDSAIPGVGIWNGYDRDRTLMEGSHLNAIRRGDTVLVALGTNDIAHFYGNPQKERQYFEAFIDRIRQIKAHGGSPVVLGVSSGAYRGFSQGLRDYANGPVNTMLRAISRTLGAPYIDTAQLNLGRTDGLHYTTGSNTALLTQLSRSCS